MSNVDRKRQLLEQSYEWPTSYTFKFIVAAAQVAEVEAILPAHATIAHRASRGGKYVSVTGTAVMACADDVLAVYAAARNINGIIGL